MTIILKRVNAGLAVEALATAAIHPDGSTNNPNQLVKVANVIGRRDPLTQFQQKVLTAAMSLIQANSSTQVTCKMQVTEFLELYNIKPENRDQQLVVEIEKISSKGLWLYEKKQQKLTRTLWFQTITYIDGEIEFQFTDKILSLVASLEPNVIEYQLIKGIQYRGKHTLAVFDIIWSSKEAKVTEYSISKMMKKLSLESTRYSYGQLKLRVLEPSLQEIYDWDDAIFVHFGPTFSGRRVEGIWFEVTTGEKARNLRKKEPEFKFASADEKPHQE